MLTKSKKSAGIDNRQKARHILFMPSMPFNPETELFRWGPIPGRFLYTSPFVEVNYKHFRKKYLRENWPETLFLFQDKRMIWINEYPSLRLSGERVFYRFMFDKKRRTRLHRKWRARVVSLLKFEKGISKMVLRRLNNKELSIVWQKFHELYLRFWTDSVAPELGNYGAEKLLEKKLGEVIPDSELNGALEALTAPTRLSFYQEEEVDLAKARDLKKHQQKYFWLNNSYLGASIVPLGWFLGRKKTIDTKIGDKIKIRIKEVRNKKFKIRKRFHLSAEIMKMAEAVSDCIAWQDERKKNIFIALHFQDMMLTEAARQTKYAKDDLSNCCFREIDEILQGNDLRAELKKRRKAFGVRFFKSYKMLSGSEAMRYWNLYAEEKIGVRVKEVRGLVVSSGKNSGVIKGRVKILLNPRDLNKMEKGDILMAPMTSPEYILALRKAAAVVTDFGGLTCHAAIVSRELGIPCVVNTKIATKVFKDGDLVEVDSGRGLIKKI